MRFTRLALGKVNQTTYAEDAGLTVKAYNNYEKGHRIGLDGAIALCNTYDLSLDWIYFGERANLPGNVIDKLESYERSARPGASRNGEPTPFQTATIIPFPTIKLI